MKFQLAKYFLLAASLSIVTQIADAQAKKKPASKTASKSASGTKATTKTTKVDTVGTNLAATTVEVTSTPVAAPKKDPLALDTIRTSIRNDAAIERNLVKERVPLLYENIREDDAWYRERVWREIDIREKMNLPFRYKAEEDNGNQRFVYILLNAIRNGGVTAFDATVDDRFTTPITLSKISELLSGKCDTTQVPDFVKDPFGTKGITRDTVVCSDFNPDEIIKFRLKEEWVFDKESSRMHPRILGIAPMKTFINPNTNEVLGETPIFWVYYPDMREILAKYEVYNGKNFGARMSWEELFESRFFSSVIVKSTIENPYDLFIKQYVKDDILRLLEGENIKEKIFNFEQDLWSY